jgi:hypothetical protein
MHLCPYYERGRFGCECPLENRIIHLKTISPTQPAGVLAPGKVFISTFYPQASMLHVGGLLLSVNHVGWGKHFWLDMSSTAYGKLLQLTKDAKNRCFHLTFHYRVVGAHDQIVPCVWACCLFPMRQGILLKTHVRRIIKAVRGFLAVRRSQRFLALAMGLHERLGKDSLVRALHTDTLFSIFLTSSGGLGMSNR